MTGDQDMLREALEVGERFLNKCNSAWSCGEPLHRVKDMLDAADKFRAALAALSAQRDTSGAVGEDQERSHAAESHGYFRAESICEQYGNRADEDRTTAREPADKAFHKGRASAASDIRSSIANLSPSFAKAQPTPAAASVGEGMERDPDWFKRNANMRDPKAFARTDPAYFASECSAAIMNGTLSARDAAGVDGVASVVVPRELLEPFEREAIYRGLTPDRDRYSFANTGLSNGDIRVLAMIAAAPTALPAGEEA